ncbi:MAG TPA: phenylacetate--CoA ligase family protein [Gallionellaceae bacterium]|nr:phenylacetate--CoA ligase family protein [Gallionellaceae bacterium]
MTKLHDIKDNWAAQGRTANNDPVAANLLSLLTQFEDSQWWSAQELQQKQLVQFALLAAHAYRHSPFFRSRFDQAGLDPSRAWTADSFTSIPLLTRAELMQQADHIYCRKVPQQHGAVHKVQTSGSTGQVVTVAKTEFNQLLWLALAMREHLWHERDFAATLAVIKALTPTLDDPAEAARLGWGHPATLLLQTGPSYAQPLAMDVAQQAAWLARIDPKYLLTYPSNLGALLDRYEHGDAVPPSLCQVRTVGETLHPGLRERCRKLGRIEIVDMYSSQEVGLIALQCPVSGLYHIQSESLIVEILDDDGKPCRPGETGRVVITDLHNFATPLIRYEIRDYAEVGPVCPCGRGLPTLARIMGRRRNMVVFPDGKRHWPLIGAHSYREVADIRQYQAIQHSLEDIEIRLVIDEPLSKMQEARLTELARQALGHPFPLRFSYSKDELPKTGGGKFEEFISLVR